LVLNIEKTMSQKRSNLLFFTLTVCIIFFSCQTPKQVLSSFKMVLNDSVFMDESECSTLDFIGFTKNENARKTVSPFFINGGLCGNLESLTAYMERKNLDFQYDYPVTNVAYSDACSVCDSIGSILNTQHKKYLEKRNLYIKGDLPRLEEWQQFAKLQQKRKIVSANSFAKQAHHYTDSLINTQFCDQAFFKYFNDSLLQNGETPHDMPYLAYLQKTPFSARKTTFWNYRNTDIWYHSYFLPKKLDSFVYAPPAVFRKDRCLQNMYGNLAEMTKEQGVAVGGSFRDSLQFCTENRIEHYQTPQYWLGFRCIYTIKKR
jgi:hypothetical protein